MAYQKFNANPEGKNIKDCIIRAISTATPLTYQQAKCLLEAKVFESRAPWNSIANIRVALSELGVTMTTAQRETVNSYSKHCDKDANYIVFSAGHAVAIVGGVIYDTWDSTRKFVQYVARVTKEKFEELQQKYNPEPKKEDKKMDWQKLFAACETIEELKKAFKKACMQCHPDKGGTAADFKAMTAAHDKRAAEIAEAESRQEWQRNKKADGTYKTAAEILAEQAEFTEILAVLMGLQGLDIEICGSWLWIGGETKAVKDTLKAAGCKWANKKKLWYWHAGEWVKKIRKTLTMDQIRDLHGSEFLKYRPETMLLQ